MAVRSRCSGQLLLFLPFLVLLILSCSRQQETNHRVVDATQVSELTDQDIEMLRWEVRLQTEHLKVIADDLEAQANSGRRIDREVLLRIENQVSRAQSRVERIEALLDLIESNHR